jgi:hypothetical protein
MLNPAQYWWDHLTRKQQLFLLSYPIPASLYLYKATEDERIKIWYNFALTNDLHSLRDFPETSIDDLRRI